MSEHAQAREGIARWSKSLFDRGLTFGSSGNISVAVADGVLITPTNACLGFLDPARIAKLDREGRHVSGDPPSKEFFLHRAFYDTQQKTGAVVHLHSTYATALSCLAELDPEDCLPSLTPYATMRVGKVRLIDYLRPGDPALGDLIRALEGRHSAVLLANHGPVVAGRDLDGAVYAMEEFEETAKLALLLRHERTRHLTVAQIAELQRAFPGMR
jgi:ribulose-5-phosphate 4-epimerase/fuculose-1-phosphate aldolase